MKSNAAVVALMAAGAVAQPHNYNHVRHAHPQHHDLAKRGQTVTEWATEWVYETVIVDSSTTIYPLPGIFMTTSTSDSSTESTSSSTSTSTEESSTEESSTEEASSTESSTTSTTSTTPTPIEETPTPTPETPTQEPTTETTPEPMPEPTTSAPEPTPTVVKPEPVPVIVEEPVTGGSSAFSADYSGFITYYAIGLGACGWSDSGRAPSGSYGDPMVVAISYDLYFSRLANPNKMELCGKMIEMKSPNSDTIAYGRISDACAACSTYGDLDVNLEGMQAFYPGGQAVQVGKGSITWRYVD